MLATMPVTLEILWDGPVPGLSEHRVSLSAFGSALKALLQALQATANALLRDAYGTESELPLLDVQIAAVEDGCARLQAAIVPTVEPSGQARIPLIPDIETKALERFVAAVESEARNQPVNEAVRAYLRALPTDVTRQRYVATSRTGIVLCETEIAHMDLNTPPRQVPSVARYTGSVVGVGFEPGRPLVRIKPDNHRILDCEANDAQVEYACNDLRGRRVEALVMTRPPRKTPRHKLIWLRDATAEPEPMDAEERMRYLGRRWHGTLEILGRSAGEE